MFSFFIAVFCLILGYVFYSKIIEKNFAPDDRKTVAVVKNDGIDYVPMPLWKLFLIQLLNIAGTGPIFGALSGALFGPIVYIWIVLGCIFAGTVHDYYCGMISMRNDGLSASELAGKYLGNKIKNLMRFFTVVLLVMCGVVFTTGPATLLEIITNYKIDDSIFLFLITIYYFISTFFSIDKVIGKIYPLFGACLIFMAVGISFSLIFSSNYTMPEIWNNFENKNCNGLSVWPYMFITVACGAISGFHATQSTLVARCIVSEKQGRLVFYGSMIAEGIIALIWASAGVTCYESSKALYDAGSGSSAVVYEICNSTMGRFGAILAMIGVIVCPISSGDTAYRSARLTLADWFKIDQSNIKKRFFITAILLGIGTIISKLDYNIVWRYFSWMNQTFAMVFLWAFSVYLYQHKRNYYFTVIPAMFMTAVSLTYFLIANECLGGLWSLLNISYNIYYPKCILIGIIISIMLYIVFMKKKKIYNKFLFFK